MGGGTSKETSNPEGKVYQINFPIFYWISRPPARLSTCILYSGLVFCLFLSEQAHTLVWYCLSLPPVLLCAMVLSCLCSVFVADFVYVFVSVFAASCLCLCLVLSLP
jgi:hypothetical protein